MSRTYRRKNYKETQNTSWDRRGRKTALEYTECNFWHYWIKSIDGPEIREMTPEEKWKQDRYWYHDNKSGVFSVPSWFCNLHERKLRQYNRRELHRFMSREDYEPMCIAGPGDASWDWW